MWIWLLPICGMGLIGLGNLLVYWRVTGRAAVSHRWLLLGILSPRWPLACYVVGLAVLAVGSLLLAEVRL